MLERSAERLLVQGVERSGGMCHKLQGGRAGDPDRICVWPQRAPVYVELKAQAGLLSPVQRARHRRLARLGFEVVTLYGANQVREWLKQILPKQ